MELSTKDRPFRAAALFRSVRVRMRVRVRGTMGSRAVHWKMT